MVLTNGDWELKPKSKWHCWIFFDGFILCIPYTLVTTSEKMVVPSKPPAENTQGVVPALGI